MIAAVIPTRYHPPELGDLLAVLLADGVQPIVLQSEEYDHAIYRMWNVGMEKARIVGATEIAILNDDVTLLPGTLPLMAKALQTPGVAVVYPDVNATWELPSALVIQATQGTWGAGGMTGFCFMVRSDIGVRFDERYHWWYGDDQFELDVRKGQQQLCRIVGLPVRHVANGSASKDWERLAPLIVEDRARFEEHQRFWARMQIHYARSDARRAE